VPGPGPDGVEAQPLNARIKSAVLRKMTTMNSVDCVIRVLVLILSPFNLIFCITKYT
jgi:hypothetical protein